LKELGQKLREVREKTGITIKEAAQDLNLRPSQLENIEAGNVKAFKDVFYLKCFLRDYAKYLGLDYDKILTEFNEFLFDYTSKIPISDIKAARRQKEEQEAKPKKPVISPYTQPKKKKNLRIILSFILALILLSIIIYWLLSNQGLNNFMLLTEIYNKIKQ
jgi:cytoskeletal protein RodZ